MRLQLRIELIIKLGSKLFYCCGWETLALWSGTGSGQIERVRTSDQSKQANKSRDSRQSGVSNPGSKMAGLVIPAREQSRRDVLDVSRRGRLYAESRRRWYTIRVKMDATTQINKQILHWHRKTSSILLLPNGMWQHGRWERNGSNSLEADWRSICNHICQEHIEVIITRLTESRGSVKPSISSHTRSPGGFWTSTIKTPRERNQEV